MRTRDVPTKASVVRRKNLLKSANPLPSRPGLRPSSSGFEKKRSQRRRQSECVEGRDQNRDRDGDGELLIHAAGDAGNGRSWNEDGRENEGNGDHRAAHLFHRLSVADFGSMPSSMWCSTASTTMMASSTTRPMASTSPKSESVLMEKPSAGKMMNVPMSETGTASNGMRVARQPCRKMKTTITTRPSASSSV